MTTLERINDVLDEVVMETIESPDVNIIQVLADETDLEFFFLSIEEEFEVRITLEDQAKFVTFKDLIAWLDG